MNQQIIALAFGCIGKCFVVCEVTIFAPGMDLSALDLMNIQRFATRVTELADYRRKLAGYLGTKMNSVAPNLTTLIGEQVRGRGGEGRGGEERRGEVRV